MNNLQSSIFMGFVAMFHGMALAALDQLLGFDQMYIIRIY